MQPSGVFGPSEHRERLEQRCPLFSFRVRGGRIGRLPSEGRDMARVPRYASVLRWLIPGIGLAALGACALSPERVATARLAEGDALAAGELNIGGIVEVAAGLRQIEGRSAICGAWRGDGAYPRDYADAILAAGSVFADGRRIQSNLSFMTEARGQLGGAASGCTYVELQAVRPLPEIAIRLPYLILERDCDGFTCRTISVRQIAYPPSL